MEESTTYQAILRKGRQQGWEEGMIAIRRDDLLALLEEKFGAVPEAVEQHIRAATDSERLKNALRQVVRIQSLDELKL